MPEMTVEVRWPDGRVESCYSPSLVLHDHLTTGATYTVAEFTERATTGLAEARERVQQQYGFACTSAAASIEQVLESASWYAAIDLVTVVRMWPPLPGEASA